MSSSPDLTQVASTGIEGLDAILGGGLPRNHVYLLEGRTGAGKTTLGLQFCLAGVAQGERVLYLTLTETAENLYQNAATHGWSLGGLIITEVLLSNEEIDPQQDYSVFDPADIELGTQIRRIREAIETHRPQRLVLDSLTTLRQMATDEWRHRRQVEFLRRLLDRGKCASLFLDDVQQPGHELRPRTLVHGLIILDELLMEYGSSHQRLRVAKMRGIKHSRAWNNYRISTGGIEVYPHLVAGAHRGQRLSKPATSAIADLDEMLGGGLARGNSTLLMGPAGTGKSSLVLCYAAAAAQRGERSLVYVFNETVENLMARGEALGLELQALVQAGTLAFAQVDPNDTSPGEFAYRLQQEVEGRQVQLVALDSVSDYMNAMPEQRFLALHFHELLTYLNHQGCVGLFTMGDTSLITSEAAVTMDLSTLVDTVVLLRFLETDQGLSRLLWVVKHRAGSHDRLPHELRFTDQGLTLGPPRPDIRGLLQGLAAYPGGSSAALEPKTQGR